MFVMEISLGERNLRMICNLLKVPFLAVLVWEGEGGGWYGVSEKQLPVMTEILHLVIMKCDVGCLLLR